MRFVVAPVIGLLVALSLFVFDHHLISRDVRPAHQITPVRLNEIVHVRRTTEIRVKQRQLPAKPEPPRPVPRPHRLRFEVPEAAPQMLPAVDVPSISVAPGLGTGPYLDSGWAPPADDGADVTLAYDSEVIPLVRVAPVYPQSAANRGIEGWVDLEFTILKDGSVAEVVILASKPHGIFDRNAKKSIVRWKFRPRVVDGKPIERRARQRLTFAVASDSEPP